MDIYIYIKSVGPQLPAGLENSSERRNFRSHTTTITAPAPWITNNTTHTLSHLQGTYKKEKTVSKTRETEENRWRSGEVNLYEIDVETTKLHHENHPISLPTHREQTPMLLSRCTMSGEEDRTSNFRTLSDLGVLDPSEPNKHEKGEKGGVGLGNKRKRRKKDVGNDITEEREKTPKIF